MKTIDAGVLNVAYDEYGPTGERGRRGLTKDRHRIARILWRQWSPTWALERTASAFDNLDFVEVVMHSYRHRYGLAAGGPLYAEIETALAAQPPIAVPAITIDGDADGVNPGTSHHARKFTSDARAPHLQGRGPQSAAGAAGGLGARADRRTQWRPASSPSIPGPGSRRAGTCRG
jgi:hypothetical protein